MAFYKKSNKGFTLLEIMLVLGVIGGIMVVALNYGSRQIAQQRREKAAIQMQQILSAALAYYTSYGAWPGGTCGFSSTAMMAGSNTSGTSSPISSLITAGYLPNSATNNTYGNPYAIACDSVTGSVFYVIAQVPSRANALVIAGQLPVAYVSDKFGDPYVSGNVYVTAQVTTPGQNLNNARSVNFVGIYHNGACVPVPSCPGYSPTSTPPACTSGSNCMTPQIMVAPVSVSGVSDPASVNAYPITSFTAFAYGPSMTPSGCPVGGPPPVSAPNVPCTIQSTTLNTGIASPSGLYWRVCLQVMTGKGIVSVTNTGTGAQAWGQYGSMVVMTRCTPPNEPFGSDFGVFTQ